MAVTERAIVVDDNPEYRNMVVALLEELRFDADATDDVATALQFKPGVSLIVLDNLKTRDKNGDIPDPAKFVSYWSELLSPLRKRHPEAVIVIVTRRSEQDLRRDARNLNGKHADTEYILGHDPFMVYLWKGTKEEATMGELQRKAAEEEQREHREQLRQVASDVKMRLEHRRELQGLLLKSVIEAGKKVMETPVAELQTLLKEKKVDDPSLLEWQGKSDTLYLDVIAEQILRQNFLPVIHRMSVVICTEETGIHNDLHHRISAPRFFVFSDPFDGSKSFATFAELLAGKGYATKCLRDIIENEELMSQWGNGPRPLNSPMISIVLAERHQVVGAVLLNLFTGDIYLSVDSGNYMKAAKQYFLGRSEDVEVETLRGIIKNKGGVEEWERHDWQRFGFHPWKSMPKDMPWLFLCSLRAGPRKTGRRTIANDHVETCVYALLPDEYEWITSFNYRLRQRDFTPGPGRVLFLTNCHTAKQYYDSSMGDPVPGKVNRYRCLLSAGEPITEWVGWFAFLRHAEGISAFCLRERLPSSSGNDAIEDEKNAAKALRAPCTHRDVGDPASMMPEELASIFRDGYLDFGVLHTAYATKMRRYKDTIAIVYDQDEAWRKKSFKPSEPGSRPQPQYERENFIRIPLMQTPKT